MDERANGLPSSSQAIASANTGRHARARPPAISEPARGTPSTVLKMLKQRVSRRLRRKAHRMAFTQRSFPFATSGDRLPRFWQPRFYDFNVWSRKKKIEKLAYMHANPLKRGLVENPKDWPWSSYSFYQKRGQILVEIDAGE